MDEALIDKIQAAGVDSMTVRSVLTCKLVSGVCASCYGRDLASGKRVAMGEAIGIIAAQSIGEPGTQLTMRTFHIGGAATKGAEISTVEASLDGKVKINNANLVQNSSGDNIVMSRVCEALLIDDKGRQKGRYKIPYGAKLLVADNSKVEKRQKIAEWDPYTIPILSEKSGVVHFKDMLEGVSVREITDEATGISKRMITESRHHGGKNDFKPRVDLYDKEGNPIKLPNGSEAKYYLPVNAILSVEDLSVISAGDLLARLSRESSKTKDITGGLPRVAEIVEARKPKDHAIIAEIDGQIEFGKDYKTKRKILLYPTDGTPTIEYVIQKGKHVLASDGDIVRKGDMIVDGHLVLQDILRIMGVEALTSYMVEEIQSVYRLQGVKIDDKHIEVIIKQMLQKVEITEQGDSNLLVGERIDKIDLIGINNKLLAQGLNEAKYQMILQGITKASLQTRSFISAASFQETTRVLTEAAIAGKVDKLEGLKENVIVGRLIPAGTGFYVDKARQAQIKAVAN
jgi:DNA-directed RNA polymerase subunit beta'